MKQPVKGLFIPILLVTLGLALAACSGKHENTVVGKWKTSQGGGDATVTFTRDGKMISEQGKGSENGDYTLSASNTLNMKLEDDSIEFAIAFTTPDEMTLTPKMDNGKPLPGNVAVPSIKFTRVSQ